jgi:hypothetical protein
VAQSLPDHIGEADTATRYRQGVAASWENCPDLAVEAFVQVLPNSSMGIFQYILYNDFHFMIR